jgi:hypothetical protein
VFEVRDEVRDQAISLAVHVECRTAARARLERMSKHIDTGVTQMYGEANDCTRLRGAAPGHADAASLDCSKAMMSQAYRITSTVQYTTEHPVEPRGCR